MFGSEDVYTLANWTISLWAWPLLNFLCCCRGHSFCRLGFNSRTVIICDQVPCWSLLYRSVPLKSVSGFHHFRFFFLFSPQCEKEFHVGCLKEHNMADLKVLYLFGFFFLSDENSISLSHSCLCLNRNYLKKNGSVPSGAKRSTLHWAIW